MAADQHVFEEGQDGGLCGLNRWPEAACAWVGDGEELVVIADLVFTAIFYALKLV